MTENESGGKSGRSRRTPAFRIPMTKKKARANEAYMMVVERAKAELDLHGQFEKEKILKEVHLSGLEFHWQVIRDIIQEDYGEELHAVAGAYFRRRLPGSDPGKYLTQGHGKKTAGYIIARENHKEIIEKKLGTRVNQIKGAAKKHTAAAINARGHIEGLRAPTLTLIEEVPEYSTEREDEWSTPRLPPS